MEFHRASAIVEHAEAIAEAAEGKDFREQIDPDDVDGVEYLRIREEDEWKDTDIIGKEANDIRALVEDAFRRVELDAISREPHRGREIGGEFFSRQLKASTIMDNIRDQVADLFQRGEDPEDQDRSLQVRDETIKAHYLLADMCLDKSTKNRVNLNRWWNEKLIGWGLRTKFKQVKGLTGFPEFRSDDTLETIKEFILECMKGDNQTAKLARRSIGGHFPEIARITGLDLMHEPGKIKPSIT